MKVMVVDDEPAMRDALELALRLDGFDVAQLLTGDGDVLGAISGRVRATRLSPTEALRSP